MSMNCFTGIGNVVADPEVRYTKDNMCVASYRIAISRDFSKDNESDFLNCKAFGKSGEFAEKYLRKGMKIGIKGRIQTGSYTNREGNKVYTTDIVVENHYFCERAESGGNRGGHKKSSDDYVNMNNGIDDDELPFT